MNIFYPDLINLSIDSLIRTPTFSLTRIIPKNLWHHYPWFSFLQLFFFGYLCQFFLPLLFIKYWYFSGRCYFPKSCKILHYTFLLQCDLDTSSQDVESNCPPLWPGVVILTWLITREAWQRWQSMTCGFALVLENARFPNASSEPRLQAWRSPRCTKKPNVGTLVSSPSWTQPLSNPNSVSTHVSKEDSSLLSHHSPSILQKMRPQVLLKQT